MYTDEATIVTNLNYASTSSVLPRATATGFMEQYDFLDDTTSLTASGVANTTTRYGHKAVWTAAE